MAAVTTLQLVLEFGNCVVSSVDEFLRLIHGIGIKHGSKDVEELAQSLTGGGQLYLA